MIAIERRRFHLFLLSNIDIDSVNYIAEYALIMEVGRPFCLSNSRIAKGKDDSYLLTFSCR